MQINTKFSQFDEVFPLYQEQIIEKKYCEICSGTGEVQFPKDNSHSYECPACLGEKLVEEKVEVLWKVREECIGTILRIHLTVEDSGEVKESYRVAVQTGPDSTATYFISGNNLFGSRKEAELECDIRNDQ